MYVGMIPTLMGGRCQNGVLPLQFLAMGLECGVFLKAFSANMDLFACFHLSCLLNLNVVEE